MEPGDAMKQHKHAWVNMGSGNSLLPDGTRPLPAPVLTYRQQILLLLTGLYHAYALYWNLVSSLSSVTYEEDLH